MNLLKLFLLSLIFISFTSQGQTAIIKGKVKDRATGEALPFATINVEETDYVTSSNTDGAFIITDVKPGTYSISISFLGYKTVLLEEQLVSTSRPLILDVELVEDANQLEDVEINIESKKLEQVDPLSIRSISSAEIFRNPGGNRDISKVLQSLPGVASTTSFRNDIIIRGGAPGENVFFLDGIEVPNINHFATQGSSGGPVGMINVNFIEKVDFYASNFPINSNNASSAVLSFTQKEGNPDRLITGFTLGSSDLALTLDGPIKDKGTFIFSLRRSYLQFLFQALQLPFLPTYNDMQFKTSFRVNPNLKLTILGLGAVDDFELNENVNNNITDVQTLKANEYILGYLPVNTQWNYTIGAKLEKIGNTGVNTLVLSRSHLSNSAIKYNGNTGLEEDLILDYKSQEIETKLRLEREQFKNNFSLKYGITSSLDNYTNNTQNLVAYANENILRKYESTLNLFQFGAFASVEKDFSTRINAIVGIRIDGNTYNKQMANPLNQFSPRVVFNYKLNEKLNYTLGSSRYSQIPEYTILGYRNESGDLLNKKVNYINTNHFVTGLSLKQSNFLRLSLEGFYKVYDNYPVSLKNGVSLANLGADFGVIGAEEVEANGRGKAYGIEFLLQQKAQNGLYGLLSYTFVRSFFNNGIDDFIPSSWDNQHLLNVTGGKTFKNDWSIGAKFRYLGGAPFTPFDLNQSSLINVWNVNQQAIFDYSAINSKRYSAVHGLDIRIDKKWYFKKAMLNVYLDVQNLYNFKSEQQAFYTVVRDQNGSPLVDNTDPSRYVLEELPNVSGTVLPSIGCMFEF